MHIQCVGQPQCNEDIRWVATVCRWLFLVTVSACRVTSSDFHPCVVQNDRNGIFEFMYVCLLFSFPFIIFSYGFSRGLFLGNVTFR